LTNSGFRILSDTLVLQAELCLRVVIEDELHAGT